MNLYIGMIFEVIKRRIQNLIFDINDIFPLLGKPLIYGWRVLHNFKFKIGKNI